MAAPWTQKGAAHREELRRRYDQGELCTALAVEFGLPLPTVRNLVGDSNRFRFRGEISTWIVRYVAVIWAMSRHKTLDAVAAETGLAPISLQRYLEKGKATLLRYSPENYACLKAEAQSRWPRPWEGE